MNDALKELLVKHDLAHNESAIKEFVLPCVGFDLVGGGESGTATSKLGGNPYLPDDFEWPINKERPLEIVLQANLADLADFDVARKLPADGLLTFFYDMEEQPWGFDLKDSAGFRVYYTSSNVTVCERQSPESEFKLPERSLKFRPSLSVPAYGSRAYDKLSENIRFSNGEADRFDEFSIELALRNSSYRPKYWGGKHRLLGHSDNVQGDMQLEAELVTKGLYCGDPSGYQDPRAMTLESNADDWILLLQVDSDESIDLMWGDVGAIYCWIKRDDLTGRHFDRTWMILQCS